MYRIFLVEDHLVMRQQYGAFLDRTGLFTVCGEASSVQEALDRIPNVNPDLVLVDISLSGDQDGIELLRVIHRRYPDLPTLVVSGHSSSHYAESIMAAGAMGYVVKGNPEAFIEALHQILVKNKSYFESKLETDGE